MDASTTAKMPWSGLSDKLNPSLVKEARQGTRQRTFAVIFIIAQLLFLSAMAGAFAAEEFGAGQSTEIIHGIVNFFCGIILPLQALTSCRSEQKGNTLELIHLTGFSRMRLIIGKYFAIIYTILLVLASSLPYYLLSFQFGGLEILALLNLLLVTMGTAMLMTALWLAVSSFRSLWGKIVAFIVLCVSLVFHFSALAGTLIELVVNLLGGSSSSTGSAFVYSSSTDFWMALYLYVQGTVFLTGMTIVLLAIASAKLLLKEEGGDRGNTLTFLFLISPLGIGLLGLFSRGILMPLDQFIDARFGMMIGVNVGWLILCLIALRYQRVKDGSEERRWASEMRQFRGSRVSPAA